MTTPPKYEDVVANLEAALGREAALREETKCLKAVLNGMEFKQVDDMVSDGIDACLFLGQESARIIKGIQHERDTLREELAEANQCICESSVKCGDLQQRLTVIEQREAELKRLLCDVINEAPTGFATLKVDLAHRVNDALKPAAEVIINEGR